MLALMVRPAEVRPEEQSVSEFVSGAIERGHNFKSSLLADALRVFAGYDGPEVSGNPDGKLPDDIESGDL